MKEKESFGLLKYVPIREWAQKKACFFILILSVCTSALHAAEEHEEMQNLYRQYMSTPSKELYETGHRFLKDGKFDEAMVCFTIVGNRYSPKMSAEEKKYCAYALNNAGGISQIRCSYSTAFSYYKKAMQVTDEPIHQTYNNIAGIYLFYKDYENARNYLRQAFDISMEQHDWESVTNALQNLIFLYWNIDSLGASREQTERYKTADSIPHDLRFDYTIALADGTLAAARGDYQEAIRLFKTEDLDLDSLFEAFHESFNAPLYIAMSYKTLGDYPMAMRYLKQVERDTRASGAMYMLMLVYKLQIECLQKSGDEKAAREARYEYMNLKDSINTAEELGKIKNIEFFDEVDRYEKQVVKLSEEKNARSRVAIIASVALLVVALLLIFAVNQNKRLASSNKELYRKNDELVKLADVEKQKRQGSMKRASEAKSTAQTDDQTSVLIEHIYQMMDDVGFIAQHDLTVERLAQAVGVHEKQVSQVINESLGKNFSTLLNEYRVREACKRLTDFEHYGTMTNETIAEGLGFKSRSHFTRTFKKITGLTPSQYQKIAKEDAVAES